jgi:hypothetical protein
MQHTAFAETEIKPHRNIEHIDVRPHYYVFYVPMWLRLPPNGFISIVTLTGAR